MGFRYLRGNQVDAQQSGSEQVRGQGGISEMYACMQCTHASCTWKNTILQYVDVLELAMFNVDYEQSTMHCPHHLSIHTIYLNSGF